MTETHLLTAGEAARTIGISPAAISKAISSGRLAYVEKTSNGYLIDPDVLFHVYRNRVKAKANEETVYASAEPDAALEIMHLRVAKAKLETELSGLRAQLHLEREKIDGLDADRKAWRKLAMKLSEIDE